MAKDKLKAEATESRPRDEKGHFIKAPDYSSAKNPIDKFILSHTGNYKDQEDLLDIRIGNPLGRVIELLEDIKRQKAFSFTLKGSLGVAGVVLVLSVFSIFGGGKIICEKGVQSMTGNIKILNYRELYSRKVPFISSILELIAPPQKLIKNRTILITGDQTTVYLPFFEDINYKDYDGLIVIATGAYNSCSKTLSIDDPLGIEEF